MRSRKQIKSGFFEDSTLEILLDNRDLLIEIKKSLQQHSKDYKKLNKK